MVFMQSLSRSFVLFSAALLVGCPAGDDTGGSVGDDTGVGATSTTSAVSASNTNGQTSQSTVDPPETSTSATTIDPPETTGEDTTGGSEFCEPQLPPPVACAPLPPGDAPRLVQLPPPVQPSGPIDGIIDSDPHHGPPSGFIPASDAGDVVECDIFLQDCAAGEKCMPWANDGGGTWNATRCSPIAPMPDAIGETCMVEGSGVSGIDTCEAASMCWNVDDTGQGTCVEMCSCSPANPVCNTDNTTCAISNDGVIAVCLTACNPLDPAACEAGQGCYPLGGQFLCAPDASGAGGEVGDECFNINACSAGLVCLGPGAVPGCVSAAGCCAATCTSGDDSMCPVGTSCMDWFQPGMAGDACWQDVGVCSG
jgi:hypothetical protein